MTSLSLGIVCSVIALSLVDTNAQRTLKRRQAYPAPYYAPCGPSVACAPPAPCGPGSLCFPAAAPPPPPPLPAPVPACAPACVAPATCLGGGCACPGPALYSPVVGCAPPPPPPPPPPPGGRLIPQALPGAPCEPGVECTGGSVCSMGICLCPPELVQEGTVCVSRTIYGVVPPVAPPPPPPPPPVFAAPAPVPVGAPCLPAAAPACAPGAFCDAGYCRCGPAFAPAGPGCVLRS